MQVRYRPCVLLALLLVLSGCERAAQPPAPVSEPVSEPVPVVAAPAVVVPARPLPPPPAEKPGSAGEKGQPARRSPESPAPPRAVVPPVEMPLPPLDLSLPDDWLESDPAPQLPSMERALLPPLFDRPLPVPGFQLGGRLIPDERQEEIEGAEISIEIRR